MPKKYSLVQDGPHALTLHDGENHFQVAKKGLTSAALKKVMSLPKYADGGEIPSLNESKDAIPSVEDSSQGYPITEVPPEPAPVIGSGVGFGVTPENYQNIKDPDKQAEWKDYYQKTGKIPEDISRAPAGVVDTAPPAPIASQTVSAPTPTPVPNPSTPMPQSPYSQFKQGVAGEEAAIKAQGDIKAKQAAEMAAAYPQYSPQEEKAVHDRMVGYQDKLSGLEQKMNESYQAAMQNKEDPNRVWNNASTGNKILAAIGIMFGAAGQHATGGQNMALNTINKAIDDDIHAQRNDTANKNSLYARNLQQYKDTQMAMDATRLQMQSIAQGKLASISTKYGGPLAQQEAAQMLNHLKASTAQQTQDLAMKQQVFDEMNRPKQPGAQESDVARKVRLLTMSGQINPAQAEQANKELASAQELEKLRADVNESSEDLKSRFLSGALTPGARDSDINTWAGILAKIGEGRFNLEESKNQMRALTPSLGDSSSTLALKDKHREQFFNALKNTPMLNGLGINVPRVTNIKTSAPIVKGK